MIKCLICGKEFETCVGVGVHIKKTHKISSQQYYDRYCRNYAKDEGFCLKCDKNTNFQNLNKGYKKYCSIKCSSNFKQTQEKYRQTCLERYGVKNPSQLDEIKNKIKETCLERYGKIHPINYNSSFLKMKRTCLERYGVDNPWKSTKVREKIKRTILEKYGVDHNSKLKEIQNKCTQTRIKNNNLASKNNLPLFNFYELKIGWVDKIRRSPIDKDILEVKCKKCNKWFIPDLISLKNRILKIEKDLNNLYCSNECKNSCSIFGQINYQRNQNPNSERPWHSEWSREVKRIANYECEICGSRKSLEAHHIEPVKTHPHLQADIDNGICLCRNCHSKYGHKDECSTGNLAKIIC